MIYPKNFEAKIGFDKVRALLREKCLSPLGVEKVDDMQMMDSASEISEKLARVSEMRLLMEEHEDFPLMFFFDMRRSVARLRLDNTHLDEQELFDIGRSLGTICKIKDILVPENFHLGDDTHYPHLQMLAEEVSTFPHLVASIEKMLDRHGRMRDGASPALARIRRELKSAEGSVSRAMQSILAKAQREGVIAADAIPTLRDGRLVLPIAPGMKRRIPGIVHDESASGKTAFVEPTEVVEANNHIRELEADERKEIVRILTEFAKVIRPDVRYIVASYTLLAHIDFLRAKLLMAEEYGAVVVDVADGPLIDLSQARHPLLEENLRKNGRKIVPLDVTLEDDRILVISGPNAGGKSVCLETIGLLQYMLQCGLPIPARENTRCGVFADIMLDMGDEQSIENDLSTYSSHLQNMKWMMRTASHDSLVLIDEFGAGTEPQIGGAIAESILTRLWEKGTYAVVTTHYQNLKHFADAHEGVANGAMLYDRKEMQALFQLQVGRLGSSFAIEIARQIGLPEDVIQMATDLVGQDYIAADKYLQDIVRDKRYWEAKRQTIHQREKDMKRTMDRLETSIEDIDAQRKAIIHRAREQAEELLREANRRIENVIREIREQQAEREATKKVRKELDTFREELSNIDNTATDEVIAKKRKQIKTRRVKKTSEPIAVGDHVRMKGLEAVGVVEKTDGKVATVIFGDMRTRVTVGNLEHTADSPPTRATNKYATLNTIGVSHTTRATIDSHRKAFTPELDVRGKRADEAYDAVMHYIDDAILTGATEVRILHGKGDGILRQIIREYLATMPNVLSFRDEHVQFGGTGITVVKL